MIRVDRAKVARPTVLNKRFRDGSTELDRVTAHMTDPEKKGQSFDFTRYKSAEVKDALEQLFHGKCAYCESAYSATQPVDVEHYRPKGKVEGDDSHPGYWWLAMEWSNLLPSCIDCNRRRNQKTPTVNGQGMAALTRHADVARTEELATGKACAFPLGEGGIRCDDPEGDAADLDAEQALLLDPTRDDPDQHLEFLVGRELHFSLVAAKPLAAGGVVGLAAGHDAADADALVAAANQAKLSPKGLMSIQVYGLNRLGLVQARARVMRELNLLLEMLISFEVLALQVEERNEKLEAERPVGGPNAKLQEQIDFNNSVLKRVRFLTAEVKGRLGEMVSPKAPYAAVARAWVKAYVDTAS